MKATKAAWRGRTKFGRKSNAASLASEPNSKVRRWLKSLDQSQLEALAYDWEFWALDHQRPPLGDWLTWLLLGGRGAGKTRAGAEWVRNLASSPVSMALVGPTFHDVREVMVEGPSGLKAIAPRSEKPRWETARRRIVWPNGAEAYAFSAEDPESLRGPQFHFAWADEFCAWPKASETLAMLRFGLRLGEAPRLMVTTTPKPVAALRSLIAEETTVRKDGPTSANSHNLAPAFLKSLTALYGGTRLAAQELEGLIVEDLDGALWRAEDLARCRGSRPVAFDKLVVAVDPPVTERGDACGIVVAGRFEGRGYVLADLTVKGMSPNGWAARVIDAVHAWDADLIVAEANQGGDMVRSTLATRDPPCPVKLVKASTGKRARAEPVAALYEQGRIVHCGAFPALEEELMALGSDSLSHSPDRADALVWAFTELMLGAGKAPKLRVL